MLVLDLIDKIRDEAVKLQAELLTARRERDEAHNAAIDLAAELFETLPADWEVERVARFLRVLKRSEMKDAS